MDFHSLTRRELQTLCKKNGIPANITNVAMADSLKALQTTVQGIDELSNCSQSLTAQSGVESPERSEVTSPRVPRTRSIRKKVGNETAVNQTQSRTRRTTRNLNSGYAADEKDTFAPINIDVQFSEVQNQSKKISTGKEAGIPQTPSMVSNTRKRVSKGETMAKTYGTRRSTRLAAKTLEDTSDAANVQLFSSDGGDNYEMSLKECSSDLSEGFQSTVSHSEVVSETSKCEEMTSHYSGVEIQNDLGSGCDSTKDCEKITEMVITEVPVEENEGDDFHKQPEVENNHVTIGENGDDFHEQLEVENNDEVIGEIGDDCYEEPEVEMKDVVTADNDDAVTKQPDSEIIAEVAAESQNLNEENDKLNDNEEVVSADGVCGVVINVMDDKCDGNLVPETNTMVSTGDILAETKDHDVENLVPEMNDLTTGDDGDMIVEADGHAAGDALVVDNGEMIVETEVHAAGDTLAVEESEESEADLITIAAEEQVDNGESDEEESESEEEEADLVIEPKEEKADVIIIVAEEQLVKPDHDDKPNLENFGVEDATSKAHIDSQMIFVDDGIVLPATAGKNNSTANTKMTDNPNALVGKENSDEYSLVAKEEKKQKSKDPKDMSMRQIRKQLKALHLGSNNNKGKSVKVDEQLEEGIAVPRPALQTLPENHQF